jgi:sarcosine oxidase subunit beta
VSELPRSASVVIIGAGVIGASIAYHLTKKGVRDVVVLERESPGAGSTGKNAGGIRQQFSTEINVRLSQLSVRDFECFAEEMGVDPAFKQVGYLFLITEERDVGPFERSLELWRRLGVPAERLDPDQTRALFPQLNVSDVRLATFCPKDGYGDPSSILTGYVQRARDRGALFIENCRATSVEVRDDRVRAVHSDGARVSCETVVNAAGPWAREVGRMANVDLPVEPFRRMVFVTERFDEVPAEFPLTVDFATSLYMHRESGGVLLGMADPDDPPGFREDLNWDFLPTVIERALYRLPVLERASVKNGWAGLYENTPDAHPIIERLEQPRGYVCAVGFSGHGLMHAPAVGRLVAELIVDGKPSVDLSTLALDRFRTGKLVREHNVI